ncbi:MAG: PHP domain-containing protein [Selenomonadaceae bacterium]|nr:PHP domain-containing protein [Selenomonadaceae bacterium]
MASDLHIHTNFSDGKFSPEETIAKAKEVGLKYIAITDHDTVEGILDLYENGFYPSTAINIIPGVEMSAESEKHEVHILGYNVDIFNEELIESLNEVAESRWTRFSEIIKKLNAEGYEISETEVLTIAGSSKSISRSHIARALVKKGIFKGIRDAFNEVLERGKPCYVPHFRLSAEKILSIIHSAGGIAVLAHPKLIYDDKLVEELLDMGMDGIEAYYPEHSDMDTAKFINMAKKRNLIITGGSDYHGIVARHDIELGEFKLDDKYAEKIYKKSK